MGMRISLFGGHDAATVDEAVSRARSAAEDGFDAIWFAQGFHLDALSALTLVARAVPDVHLGTAVVPIQGRHPVPLALQALTVASAAGPDRFTLGVGVTHQAVSEQVFGIPYRSVLQLCAQELEALDGLLGAQRHADLAAPGLTARATLVPTAPTPGLVLAALGPRMLDLAGRHCDGTVTWMTGAGTLAHHVVPTISEAARRAERPPPRVIAGLPVCVTDEATAAFDRINAALATPARLASYRRMLRMEGVDQPAQIALIGDEPTVGRHLAHLEEIGVTELMAAVHGTPEEVARTRQMLGNQARG